MKQVSKKSKSTVWGVFLATDGQSFDLQSLCHTRRRAMELAGRLRKSWPSVWLHLKGMKGYWIYFWPLEYIDPGITILRVSEITLNEIKPNMSDEDYVSFAKSLKHAKQTRELEIETNTN